jgi:hypothetical protein
MRADFGITALKMDGYPGQMRLLIVESWLELR